MNSVCLNILCPKGLMDYYRRRCIDFKYMTNMAELEGMQHELILNNLQFQQDIQRKELKPYIEGWQCNAQGILVRYEREINTLYRRCLHKEGIITGMLTKNSVSQKVSIDDFTMAVSSHLAEFSRCYGQWLYYVVHYVDAYVKQTNITNNASRRSAQTVDKVISNAGSIVECKAIKGLGDVSYKSIKNGLKLQNETHLYEENALGKLRHLSTAYKERKDISLQLKSDFVQQQGRENKEIEMKEECNEEENKSQKSNGFTTCLGQLEVYLTVSIEKIKNDVILSLLSEPCKFYFMLNCIRQLTRVNMSEILLRTPCEPLFLTIHNITKRLVHFLDEIQSTTVQYQPHSILSTLQHYNGC